MTEADEEVPTFTSCQGHKLSLKTCSFPSSVPPTIPSQNSLSALSVESGISHFPPYLCMAARRQGLVTAFTFQTEPVPVFPQRAHLLR